MNNCWLTWFKTFCTWRSCSREDHEAVKGVCTRRSIFASYYALLRICYCFSHLIGLFSVTWLSLLYKFTVFFNFLFLSDEEPTLKTLEFTIQIGSTQTFLYLDLYLYSAYAAHYVYNYWFIVYIYIYIYIYIYDSIYMNLNFILIYIYILLIERTCHVVTN